MYLKSEQTAKNKDPKITSQDKKYLSWLHNQEMACIVCGTYENIEFHHMKLNSSMTKNHKKILPLCVDHHRFNTSMSPHSAPRKFREQYPIEAQEQIANRIYDNFLESE